jgi:TPR repeat protein
MSKFIQISEQPAISILVGENSMVLIFEDKDEKLPIDGALEEKKDVSKDSTLLKLLEEVETKIADATSATEKFPPKLCELAKVAAKEGSSAQTALSIFDLNAIEAEGDSKKSVSQPLLLKVIKNCAEALFLMGNRCIHGIGMERDDKKAVEWFLKAAKLGNANAQNMLGACYQEGRGVAQDAKKSFEWYEKAAKLGNSNAQNTLGSCYQQGRGVAQDAKKSFEWYEKAAKQGNHAGQNCLGACYYTGHGVDEDKIEAMRWFHQAADEGNQTQAQFNLYVAYKERKDLKKAYEYCQKAAEQGHVKAQLILGRQDEKSGYLLEAKAYYEKAATSGDKEANQHMTRLQALVDSRFLKAIEEGNSEEVKVLIQRGTDVHKSTQGLQTALERAILTLDKAFDLSKSQQENYLNIITQLVCQGAGLFLLHGGPLWIQANTFHRVQKRYPEILSALSESKIDNVSEMLSHFCQLGNLPFFLFLIDKKPNIPIPF